MKAVLIGNYGVGNFGDEALREYFLTAFPEVEWTVLSAHPTAGEYPRLPIGVRSLFGTPWWRTLAAIRRCDAVVFGGGTLFTDIESVKACFLWGVHALAARAFGVPVFLAFQGVGPFKTHIGEGIARRVVRMARHVSVRDASSFARVRSWNPAAIETFDPVFALFLQRKKPRADEGSYVLIPRHNSGVAFDRVIDFHADDAKGAVVIAAFQPDDPGEGEVIERVRRRFPQASVRRISDVDDLMDLLSRAGRCVTERFHGALAAVAAEAPLSTVAQADGDKISGVQATFGSPDGYASATRRVQAGEDALRSGLDAVA